ncbi:MAG: hypothetical protein IMX04_06915 [Candidatus Carbobacillus altaicus]|nr:hypothetical protein [Candidatus Carbobacillus altaicus]
MPTRTSRKRHSLAGYPTRLIAYLWLVVSLLSLSACGEQNATAYDTLQKSIEDNLEKTGQATQGTMQLVIKPEYKEGYTPDPETETIIRALNGLQLYTETRIDQTSDRQEITLKGSFPYQNQNVSFHVDLMGEGDVYYLRIKELSTLGIPELQAILPFFLNKWIKLDAQQWTELDGQTPNYPEQYNISPPTLNRFMTEALLVIFKALGPDYFSLVSADQKAPPAVAKQKASQAVIFQANKEKIAEIIKRLATSAVPALYDLIEQPEYAEIKKIIHEQDASIPKSRAAYEQMLKDNEESFEKALNDFQNAVETFDIELTYWLDSKNIMVASAANMTIILDDGMLKETTENGLDDLSKLTIQLSAEEGIELFDEAPPFQFDYPPAAEDTIDLGAMQQSVAP